MHYSSENDIQNALADYAAMQPKLQIIRTFIEAKLPDTDVRRKFIESIKESLLRKTPNHEVYIRSDLLHYATGYNIPNHLLNDIGKEIEAVTGIPATASSIMR